MTVRVPDRNEKDLSKITLAISELAQGRSNATGTCTLTISVTTTQVTAPTCAPGSTVVLTPTTAHASAEFGNGTIYISTVAAGSFTITHASNTQADRTFLWAILG